MGTGISTNRFLSSSDVSDGTKSTLLCLLQELPHMTPGQVVWSPIESFLSTVPKGENILSVSGADGYNLLQWSVGLQSMELVRWCISQEVDVNRGSCSLPLHIASLTGNVEMTELLLRNGAKSEVETRMCFPGPHSKNCELRRHGVIDLHPFTLARVIHSITGTRSAAPADPGGQGANSGQGTNSVHRPWPFSDKCQDAMTYAIDGDQAEILELLLDSSSGRKYFWNRSRPLLLTAFERGAWNCVKFLLPNRQDEVNVSSLSSGSKSDPSSSSSDEYFPIHEAVIHDDKFVQLLLQCNVDISVKTVYQQASVLHVLLLRGRKSGVETIGTLRLLFDHGGRELINEPDSMGNTPLHALIIRYALEKSRQHSASNFHHCPLSTHSAQGIYLDQTAPTRSKPWTKWDMLHVLQFMLQNKAAPSINSKGNSLLAFVIRHIKDWEFRYELLCMLLENGGDPNIVGRDGSVPLLTSLIPLLNPGQLLDSSHKERVSFINSVRILCKYGANPNWSLTPNNRKHLTPLHVLAFIANEYIQYKDHEKDIAFPFILSLLLILSSHNLHLLSYHDNILKSISAITTSSRKPSDLSYITQLTLTLIQHGADPNTFHDHHQPTFCSSQASVFIKKPTNYVLFYFVQQLIKREDLLIFASGQEDAHQRDANHQRDADQRREDATFVPMIELFYHSMDHACLMACLKELLKQSTLGPLITNSVILKETLKKMLSTPRSLKSISRHAIYKSLGGKMVPNVNKLDLPPRLKSYLLDFKS